VKEDTVRTHGPGYTQTFDAIPEDDERQEELNRTMRKPGEPPYCPPVSKPKSAPAESDQKNAGN
jgi:hypothetical protein